MSSSKQQGMKGKARKISEKIQQDEKLLQQVVEQIPYEGIKHVLVKPLEPIKVTKDVPKGTGKFEEIEDKDGVKSSVEIFETVEETMDSGWRTGVVLQIPQHLIDCDNPVRFKVGDIVVYPMRTASYFDLFKDSMFINSYDVVAVKKPVSKW